MSPEPIIFSRLSIISGETLSGELFVTKQKVRNFTQNVILLMGETLSGDIFVGKNHSYGEIFVTFVPQ